ncbi:hypothetical protein HYH03_014952 [Edaphochlamys debaryana]|uniref:phytol kinase n=1 Tax=Edaphochlamys debaryana TaxID=47281 RepID=A0A836BRR0_9CHLO|nr:hypothetical protein HYH03_014952 [Edaphochlamys debaryana]|eukprot:KAG2486372.1 hypothetical protein HYH03_014952 [Edaphochlamys debaryana]
MLDTSALEVAAVKILAAVKQVDDDVAMAASVLGNDAILTGIVQLASFAFRLPLPDSAADSPDTRLLPASALANSLLSAEVSAPAAVAGQLRLARGLFKTGALYAAARQMAAAAGVLQRHSGPPSADFCKAALGLLHTGLGLGPCLLARIATGRRAEADEAASGLFESRLLEHGARLLLLLRMRVPQPAGAVTDLELAQALVAFAFAFKSGGAIARATPLPGYWAGPCAQHAALVVGLAALGELEGGAGGGDGGGGGGAGGGAPCACLGGGPPWGRASPVTPLMALLAALRPTSSSPPHPMHALNPQLPNQPPAPYLPRPLTAARLLLREGFALAAIAGPQGAAAGAGGAGGSRGPAPAAELVSLHSAKRADVLLADTLALLITHLAEHQPWNGPWLGAAQEAWRLAGAAVRGEAQGAGEVRTKLCQPCAQLVCDLLGASAEGPEDTAEGAEGTPEAAEDAAEGAEETATAVVAWCFPAEAPPPVAAALAGGALPFLERLLRRAGDEPQGLEAGVLTHMGRAGTGSFADVIPLLVYGEPLQAAALVATVTKLLRRTQAEALLGGEEPRGDEVGPLAAVGLLTAVLSVDLPVGESCPSALSRLAQVLSLALPEWLPELSRLVRQAAALDQAAWAEGQRREGRRQPGAGGDTAAVQAPDALCSSLNVLMNACSAIAVAIAGPSTDAATSADGRRCGGAASGSSGGGAASGCSSGLGWPPAGLAEAEVVGAALGLLQRCAPDPGAWPFLYLGTGLGVARLAETRPEKVRALSASGSAFAWQAEAVRAVAEVLGSKENLERLTEPGVVEPLVRRLEAWAAGEDGSRGPGDMQGAGGELVRSFFWGCWLDGTVAQQLVPPAEARRRLGLPACSNPACANLAGDSEAGLRLQQCGRCGRASYCCRDCQTAHWRSGHKEACGGGGGRGKGKGD